MMKLTRLPKVTKEQAAEHFTRMILMGYFPSGCHCEKMTSTCGWCREWPRLRVKVLKILNRIVKD